MTNNSKHNSLNEIIDSMILNTDISPRVFKSIIITMRKSKTLRPKIEGFVKCLN